MPQKQHTTPVRFIDDPEVQECIAQASKSATDQLATLFPPIADELRNSFVAALQAELAQLLGKRWHEHPPLALGDDAFGDPFDLTDLPLARPGTGYAIQRLDTDTLLDRNDGHFRAVRDPQLQGLFASFADAFAAAKDWLKANPQRGDSHVLAIVPAYFDDQLHRHVLIYGVLTEAP